MGIVYLAQDAEFRAVALKVLRPEFAGRDDFRRRFTREAQAARKVARFCTAPVLDAGIEGDTAYIVTEYVDGPDLASVIASGGPMGGANLEALAVGVATALAAIHEAGVVHRDLKPSNILLSAVGPRVIDFGIAGLADPDATQSATVAGTPAYMAPEQANGGTITTAGDVFAWGGVVTYAGTGRPPFGTGAMPEVLYRVAHHAPILDGLDERLRPLVEQSLQKDPARRPTTQQLLDRLLGRERATIASATQVVSDAWTPLLSPPLPESARRPWVTPLAAAALAVVVTAGAFLALSRLGQKGAVTAGSVTTKTVTATTTQSPEPGDPTPVRTNTVAPGVVITPGSRQAAFSFIHINASDEKVRAVVQIDSLAWQGDNVKLQYTVRNDAAQESINLFGLIESDSGSSDGIELILADQPFPFTPMFEGNNCACSSWWAGAFLRPGLTERGYAVFRKVPKTAKVVDLDLKNVGLFKNVLITR